MIETLTADKLSQIDQLIDDDDTISIDRMIDNDLFNVRVVIECDPQHMTADKLVRDHMFTIGVVQSENTRTVTVVKHYS